MSERRDLWMEMLTEYARDLGWFEAELTQSEYIHRIAAVTRGLFWLEARRIANEGE